MDVVRLPDELQRVIEREVAEGRAASAAAFLTEAVMRLIDEAEGDELRQVVAAGSADIEAGRCRTVATPDDERDLRDDMMTRLRSRPSTDGSWAFILPER